MDGIGSVPCESIPPPQSSLSLSVSLRFGDLGHRPSDIIPLSPPGIRTWFWFQSQQIVERCCFHYIITRIRKDDCLLSLDTSQKTSIASAVREVRFRPQPFVTVSLIQVQAVLHHAQSLLWTPTSLKDNPHQDCRYCI